MEPCSIGYFTADALDVKWGSFGIVRTRSGLFYSCELYPDNQVFAESSFNLSKFELPQISLIKSRQFAELVDGSYISIISEKEVIQSQQITVTLMNINIGAPDLQFVEKQIVHYLRSHVVPLVNGTKFNLKLITNQNAQLLIENKTQQQKFFRITPTTKINLVHNQASMNSVIEYPSFIDSFKKLSTYVCFSIYNQREQPKAVGFQGFLNAKQQNNSTQNKLQNQHPKGVLISGCEQSGRKTLVRYTAEKLNLKIHEIDADNFNSTQLTFPELTSNIPSKTIVLLKNFDPIVSGEETGFQKRVLTQLTDLIDRSNEVFFAMTVVSTESIPNTLQSSKRLSFKIVLPPLSNSDIQKILPSDFSQTAFDLASGIPIGDLVVAAENHDENELFDSISNDDGSKIKSSVAKTSWDDIGGLSLTKAAVREAVEWPLTRANELKKFGVKPPRGVLLYGPPGCGKTMIARAIATSLSSSFFAISAASVFQMYLGESERIVRDLFALARQKAPAVIFIDEIDAMVGKRGKVTGVSERVLSTFLNEMDGITTLNDVIVVAATNRKDSLDEALSRPGRFDCLIEVLPCMNEKDISEVLSVCTRKMPLEDNVIQDVSKLIKIGTSGAEIDNICREAALIALNRNLNTISSDCFQKVIEKYQKQ